MCMGLRRYPKRPNEKGRHNAGPSQFVRSALAVAANAPACGFRFAGIAECLLAIALNGADRSIFAGAELRTVRAGASRTIRAGAAAWTAWAIPASAAAPAFAGRDDAVALGLRHAGIAECLPIAATLGADRVELLGAHDWTARAWPCRQWARSRAVFDDDSGC